MDQLQHEKTTNSIENTITVNYRNYPWSRYGLIINDDSGLHQSSKVKRLYENLVFATEIVKTNKRHKKSFHMTLNFIFFSRVLHSLETFFKEKKFSSKFN